MRPLVYDFGQLNTDTESRYTKQIVQDHVRKNYFLNFNLCYACMLGNEAHYTVCATQRHYTCCGTCTGLVTKVYERKRGTMCSSSEECLDNISYGDQQDECSFVSLRDVERAMLVFVYFFDKRDLLRDAINKKESDEDESLNVSYNDC